MAGKYTPSTKSVPRRCKYGSLFMGRGSTKFGGVYTLMNKNTTTDTVFVLVIASTDLATVPGLSAAGANSEVVQLTAPADADVIRFGQPRVTSAIPFDPQGHPSPSLITWAAAKTAGFPVAVLRAGTLKSPYPPYIELNASSGGDPRKAPAVPNADAIMKQAASLAPLFAGKKSVMLAESIPGGTTTALLVLRALGYTQMVSSAGPQNPISLKESIWTETAKRIGITAGGLAKKPLQALTELGDPMQAAVAGLALALPDDVEVLLAGGTQMLAVAALIRAFNAKRRPTVATTKYVAMDKSSGFAALAAALEVPTWVAQLDFTTSPYPGLRDYEKGFVKEGVGAGGSCLLAERLGVPIDRIVAETNAVYKGMVEKQ
jgi:uncharacterized protein (TIGR00303 family)